MTATKDQFFKPAKLSADAKVNQTNTVVREILDTEAAARDKKTENLRALRLAREAAATPAPKKTGRGSK
ncbi:MAG: hypothetical protein PW791_13910 [Neorhizobium sp.]|jgi:hypothetical protein|nr:hypothetical protein [Neorhizobium sp.]